MEVFELYLIAKNIEGEPFVNYCKDTGYKLIDKNDCETIVDYWDYDNIIDIKTVLNHIEDYYPYLGCVIGVFSCTKIYLN